MPVWIITKYFSGTAQILSQALHRLPWRQRNIRAIRADPVSDFDRTVDRSNRGELGRKPCRPYAKPTAYSKYQFFDALNQDCHAEISMRLAADILAHAE